MAKKAARDVNISINAVAVEGYVTSSELAITQETPDVTTYADAGPRRVVGNYDYGLSLEGANDFASGTLDATIFALVGSTGVAMAVDPTGASAGANDPNYDATSVVLESYSLKAGVGAPSTFSAKLNGNSALARAVA